MLIIVIFRSAVRKHKKRRCWSFLDTLRFLDALGTQEALIFYFVFFSVQRGEGTKREIFRLFLPSDILCDIVSSCHLRKLSATIYFAILGPNSVLRSFPYHWSGPPVLPNSANAHPPPSLPTLPTPPQKRNKEDSSPPQKRKQRRQGWNYGIAN